ncbi:myelin-oligodendrocyte glycoprotein-like [Poeciliopsis prolifica]|uniref:myelin-oligodendrocyte glycoprotein-like n=1 Tax=Poeciliopsis prolifica TaxID=188132 RepID=UPI002413FF1A|nr:myelin-oligodendrocyte glycoprotein-like [Poeciliopsis prolifica]
MASSLPASLFLLSVVFWQFVFWEFVTAAEQTNIKATTGEDVTLPCSDPDNNPILVVQWSRPRLGPKFVLLFKNGMIDEDQQHPSFKGRVELLDSNMKDGDVSMILKKVQASDAGQFECRVIQMAHGEELRRKVYLEVIEPFPAWVIVLAVLLSVFLIAAVVLVYRFKHHITPAPRVQEEDEDDEGDEDEDDEGDGDDDVKMNSED